MAAHSFPAYLKAGVSQRADGAEAHRIRREQSDGHPLRVACQDAARPRLLHRDEREGALDHFNQSRACDAKHGEAPTFQCDDTYS